MTESKCSHLKVISFVLSDSKEKTTSIVCPVRVCLGKNGTLLISDSDNHRIVAYKWNGKEEKFLAAFGEYGQDQGEFDCPWGVCVDSKNRLAVADWSNYRIQVLDILPHRVALSFLCCLLLP